MLFSYFPTQTPCLFISSIVVVIYHVLKLRFECLSHKILPPVLYSHFHLFVIIKVLTAKVLLQAKEQLKVAPCKVRAVNDIPSNVVNEVLGPSSSVWSDVMEKHDTFCQHATAFLIPRLKLFQCFLVCVSVSQDKPLPCLFQLFLNTSQNWVKKPLVKNSKFNQSSNRFQSLVLVKNKTMLLDLENWKRK